MKALDEILVLIPDGDERLPSVAVCSVGDLLRELGMAETLEEAIEAAAIDAPMHVTPDTQLPEIGHLLAKMRKS